MIKVVLYVVGVFVGSFAVVFGEADDSPGLQGLGVILAFFCLYKIYRKLREESVS
jgi:hypothetical protein